MKKILVLHAYSAHNSGDGLLVEETIGLAKRAFGEEAVITVAASHPDSFEIENVQFLDSMPNRLGYRSSYVKTLLKIGEFDAVPGVGGGYLRGGSVLELLKTILVHGPQILASASTKTPTMYLPQSIGPFRLGTAVIVRALLRRLSVVYLRDDRSVEQFGVPTARRGNDLALLGITEIADAVPNPTPVLSVRPVRGRTPPKVVQLATKLRIYDAFVQSRTSGNDDRSVTESFSYRSLLPGLPQPLRGMDDVRVVVAVRLHAALMALQAGHYVIHLAYERKGFGAFSDLGLDDHVHNVNSFDPDHVAIQVDRLLHDSEARRLYRESVALSGAQLSTFRAQLISELGSLTDD